MGKRSNKELQKNEAAARTEVLKRIERHAPPIGALLGKVRVIRGKRSVRDVPVVIRRTVVDEDPILGPPVPRRGKR